MIQGHELHAFYAGACSRTPRGLNYKLCSDQPQRPMAKAASCGRSVRRVRAPPDASSIRCRCRPGLKGPQGSGRCSGHDKPATNLGEKRCLRKPVEARHTAPYGDSSFLGEERKNPWFLYST